MNRTKIEYLDYDRGWLEALIDSEGSISLIKRKRANYKAGYTYMPTLNISNKNRILLEKAQSLIGGGHISKPHPQTQVCNFYATANICRKVLPSLTLIVKEKQRKLLLEALTILEVHTFPNRPRSDEEILRLDEIHREISQLNGGRFLHEQN